jgi:GNAT superfamily N-acetyltransferase
MPIMIFRYADESDVAELLGLRLRVDADQTRRFGRARWSTAIDQNSVARGLKTGRVLIALQDGRVVGGVRMEARKPWAIDLSYFTPAARPLYLHDVNIEPALQGRGLGAKLVEEVKSRARDWSADAIRVDTFDGAAGAGPFYEKCGFRAVGRKTYRSVPLAYFELLLAPTAPIPRALCER